MSATAPQNGVLDLPSSDHPDTWSNGHHVSEQYGIPPPEPITSFAALKDRIRQHYELASDYYYSLWLVSVATAGDSPLMTKPGVSTFITATFWNLPIPKNGPRSG